MASVIKREQLIDSRTFSFAKLERAAESMAQRAQAEARRIIADARERAADEARTIRETAHQQGLAEGREAGRAEIETETRASALAAQSKRIEQLLHTLDAAFTQIDQNRHRLLAQAESGFIELAVRIARRVCKTLPESNPAVVKGNVEQVLQLTRDAANAELHLHPDDQQGIADWLPQLAARIADAQHVRLVADESVGRGGVVLHATPLTVDAQLTTQLEQIAAALCENAERPIESDGAA